jgi:ubiquinone biosynthesis protein COQ4
LKGEQWGAVRPQKNTIYICVSYYQYEEMMTAIHIYDPLRPAARLRPFKALGHFQKLIIDKEDTEQVFHMTDCLPSAGYDRVLRSFCESREGQMRMVQEAYLPDLLDDHDRLLAMPAGSVAHAYVAFMRAEGLSAAGLVAESEKAGRPRFNDRAQWFHDRLRDTHDLVHVLTGYGRDPLGEQCALGFSYGQYRAWTDGFLSWAGSFELWRRVKADAPVFAAVREAIRIGKAAEPIFKQDIAALLAEPLEAARARMNIGTSTHYARAHKAYRARGLDPYNFSGGAALA